MTNDLNKDVQLSVAQALDLEQQGKLQEAEQVYSAAIRNHPKHPLLLHLLGLLHYRTGRFNSALPLIGQSVQICPENADFTANLALLFGTMGRIEESISCFRRALSLQPCRADWHNNLGVTYERARRYTDAASSFKEAARLQPNAPTFWTNYANAIRRQGDAEEAEQAYRRAMAVDVGYKPAQQSLAALLQEQGRHGEAVDCLREVIQHDQKDATTHSALLYALHYVDSVSREQLFDEHLQWARRHEEPVKNLWQPHINDLSPDRRLRIGYVSPDFRGHSVTTFFEPLLSNHDRERFEIFLYSSTDRSDGITSRLKSKANLWRDIHLMDDATASKLIRSDHVDILVDLTGHMPGNRLTVFARKPAPVQITYVGHPNTTGMSTIDYRITDPFLDPVDGGSDKLHSEQLLCLPRVFGCYLESTEAIEMAEPPALSTRSITFGCLNNSAKITERCIAVWSRILKRLPGSKLTLLANPSAKRLRSQFAAHGIPEERVRFLGRLEREEYLRAFNHIDIALDCFPYNGQTTSCDGFWMGVPLIALEGNSYVSRMGLSLLHNLKMPELIAADESQYEELALKLANDQDRLVHYRSQIRERLRSSPIMDAPGLARDIEAAYRQVWHTWCNRRRNEPA